MTPTCPTVARIVERRILICERGEVTSAALQAKATLVRAEGNLMGGARREDLSEWARLHPGRSLDDFPWLPVTAVPEWMSVSDAAGVVGRGLLVAVDGAGAVVGVAHPCDLAACLAVELGKAQARLGAALETFGESVSMIDEEGRVIAWNSVAEKLFGIEADAILGRPLAEFFPPKDQWSLRSLTSGVSVHQTLHEPRPGTWVIINAAPIRFQGRIIGALAVEQNMTKMVSLNELLYQTKSEVKALQGVVSRFRQSDDPFERIRGKSPSLQAAIDLARKVAASDVTVLIRGESGVGKELFARAVHDASTRRDKPFVAINCGAIPTALFESELFGYERGAFTGADQKGKTGKLEQAQGGTLFLDEIAELSTETQVKLLRVLQDGRYYRLGSDRPRAVDIRVVAATNRNLEEMLHKGSFRGDLYFRLDVVSLEVPPLRERPSDLAELVHEFVQEFAARYHRPIQAIDPQVMMALTNHNWPGNVREVRNVIERLVVLSDDGVIRPSHLPASFRKARETSPPPQQEGERGGDVTWAHPDLPEATREARRHAIRVALAACGGNRSMAAKRLGISRSAIYYQMRHLGME